MGKQPNHDEHSGVQIKVWLPEPLYDLIAARAEEHGSNRSAEVRDLVVAGIRAEQGTLLELDHLERLTYKAALESLAGAELFAVLLKHLFAGEDVDAKLKAWQREAQGHANAKLNQYLSTKERD